MSQQLRFNHVLLVLLALAAVSAITLPASVGSVFRGKIDNFFWPVARLTRAIASTVDEKFTSAPPAPTDKNGKVKTATELQDEVDSLTYLYSNVKKQLDDLQLRNSEMASLGPAAEFSIPYKAFGGDAGTRQTLSLSGSSLTGLRPDMAVICKDGIVGRLSVSVNSARVVLITDPQAKALQCSFIRFVKDSEPMNVSAPPFAVTAGDQPGTLKVDRFKMIDVWSDKDPNTNKVQVHDIVVLADSEWPEVVQGMPVGEVVSITASRNIRLFAEIVIKPKTNLMKLTEVMVVNPDLKRPLRRETTGARPAKR